MLADLALFWATSRDPRAMLAYLDSRHANVALATDAVRLEAWRDLYRLAPLASSHPIRTARRTNWRQCLDACRWPLYEKLWSPGPPPLSPAALDGRLCDAIRGTFPTPP